MQFNPLDNKIKEAANNHHPAYDEKAWSDMEKLLNKHLPQKQDDRKRFLFLLLLLISLSGAVFLIAKPWKGNKTIAAADQTIQQKSPAGSAPAIEQPKEISKTTISPVEEKNRETGTGINENSNKTVTDLLVPGSSDNLAKQSNNPKNNKKYNKSPVTITTKTEKIQPLNNDGNKGLGQENSTKNRLSVTKASITEETTKPVNDVSKPDKLQNESVSTKNPVENNTVPVLLAEAKTGEDKKEVLPITQQKTGIEKKKTKNNNSFFVSLSTGPDVSFAGAGKLGTVKMLAGAGIGYTFKNHLSLRAGFYSGRKIYTALPDAYHPPAIFYTYYPNLEKVDANCKVYEIPFSISYNFGRTSKQNWFASAGVSSFLMKSETYNYFYKYSPTGPTINRKRTINNENKHYLSALTFSGGYLYNINRRLSFMVEPYIKVPLSGVGYGKVKLNSGGILFSIGIKPFGSKKAATNK